MATDRPSSASSARKAAASSGVAGRATAPRASVQATNPPPSLVIGPGGVLADVELPRAARDPALVLQGKTGGRQRTPEF